MRKKVFYIFIGIILGIFLLMNYVAYNHSYKFTHYSTSVKKIAVYDTSHVGFNEKMKHVISGVSVPKPINDIKPGFEFNTNYLRTDKGKIEIWETNLQDAKGTVIMFHGYANRKASLIERAQRLVNMDCNV